MVIRRRSGKVVEESTVFVPREVKQRRNKRKGTTTAEKMEENERCSVKKLARAINCNFGHGDLWTTQKYSEAGMEVLMQKAGVSREQVEARDAESLDKLLAAAEREGQLYMRRIGRELAKEGVDIKYILITSDMDGETGEMVRVHHHLIIPRVGFEVAAKKWGLGTVDYQILKAQDDYTPLAEYLMRQVRRRPDAKKYTPSRNLEKPIVNEHWAKPGEILAPDRGATLVHRSAWEPGRGQYIRFVVQDRTPGKRDELGERRSR